MALKSDGENQTFNKYRISKLKYSLVNTISGIAGSLDQLSVATGVGGTVDGVLRQHGAFSQEGLVHVPDNLNWLEASTLGGAALTVWNAFYGLEGRAIKPGGWVITQGTGGVSIFAVQVCIQNAQG